MNISTNARYKATQNAINELIDSVKRSITVLEKFDNKVVNVKLINELRATEIESYVSLQTINGGKKSLVFKATNRSESYSSSRAKYPNYVYSEKDSTSIILQFKECNKRLNFSATKIALEENINYLYELLERYTINESVFSELEKKFDLLHVEIKKLLNTISYQEKQALLEKQKYKYFKIIG